jgi:hypothetical protein
MYELDTSGFCILGNIIAFKMATEVSVVFIHVPETSQAPLDATPQILPPVELLYSKSCWKWMGNRIGKRTLIM